MKPNVSKIEMPEDDGASSGDAKIPEEALASPDQYVTWRINKFVEGGRKEYDQTVFESFKTVLNEELKERFDFKNDLNILIIPDLETPGGLRVFVKDRPDDACLNINIVGDKDVLKQIAILIENTAIGVVKELPHKIAYSIDEMK